MKAMLWTAPRQMHLADVPAPEPGPGEVLLRVDSVGVCGSDIHYFVEGGIGAQQIREPFALGHEYAGIIEAAGEGVSESRVGERVTVEPGYPCGQCEWCRTGRYNVCPDMGFPGTPPRQGCLCDYYCAPAAMCFPIPDSMSMAEAAMVEPLAVAIHVVELCQLRPGDDVAVFGLGPLGLLIAQVLRTAGAGAIYGCDRLFYRADAGLENGCDKTFNAAEDDPVARLRDWTRGRGPDVCIDATNAHTALPNAILAVRPAGRVVHVGISGHEEDVLPVAPARRKELTLQWVRRFCNNYPTAIQWTASKRVDVSKLITHSYPLEQSLEAFNIVADYADNVLKASIDR